MADIDKVVKLLGDTDVERRCAAAIVLGAIGAKGPKVKSGLTTLVKDGSPPEQRAALGALSRIGAKSAMAEILELICVREASVRTAAAEALLSIGEPAVAAIEKRREHAGLEEKRALDSVLAHLGGDTAFHALLEGLIGATPEDARSNALQVRAEIKAADSALRRKYLSQVKAFLKRKDVRDDAGALAAGLKILGYLEDKKTIPLLLDHATDETLSAPVRNEALIALRFALGATREAPEVAETLLQVAHSSDARVARAALDTLANLDLPKKLAAQLGALAQTGGPGQAAFAIGKLKDQGDKPALQAIVDVIAKGNINPAKLAGEVLVGVDDAVPLALKALLATEDSERAHILREVLRPAAGALTKAQKKKLVDAVTQHVADGTAGYESLLQLARDADPDAMASALRDLAAKLKKARKADKAAVVLGLLAQSGGSSAEDKFKLAMLELKKSKLDHTSKALRSRDPALKVLQELLDDGADVLAWLKKERSLELEALFYLGFHFIEADEDLGEEVLELVAEKGGRKKIAKMAKNKLKTEAET